ncbi:MAG: aspartate carbamoyltransferase catalytic subunit [Planktomarina sp.]
MTDPWDGLLGANERIRWQGAPKARVRLEWASPFTPFFFLFFTGFSVFWMIMAGRSGGFFWTFGLLFFGVGIYNLLGVHFWNAYVRSQHHYTLTNQRAIIGTKLFGRKKLNSYPITKDIEITFEDAGDIGDIYFAKRETRGKNGITITPIGFEQIENPRQVLALMRQVQEDR